MLVMLAAFFFVLYLVTGRTGPTDAYYVTYTNITGVKYGTPVLYEGYQVGQVEDIEPKREAEGTKYKLTLAIAKDWTIPDDSVASLVASGLLSAITVEIKEGKSKTLLKPGEYLEGQEAANIFTAVNEVAGELQTLSRDSLKPMIDNLNNQVNSLANELKALTTESIRPLVDNINEKLDKQIFADIDSLLSKLNEGSDRLLLLMDDNNLDNLNQFLLNMQTASSTLNDLLDRIEETRAAMNGVLIDIDHLVVDNKEDVKSAVNNLQKSLDVISQNINTIIYHMEGSSRNMHELSRQLRENPSLILKASPQTEGTESE